MNFVRRREKNIRKGRRVQNTGFQPEKCISHQYPSVAIQYSLPGRTTDYATTTKENNAQSREEMY